jgi:hypothetical protein
MTTDSDIPQTKAEAIKRGYKKHTKPISEILGQLTGVVHLDTATLAPGGLCLYSKCGSDGTRTVCYYNGTSCDDCHYVHC